MSRIWIPPDLRRRVRRRAKFRCEYCHYPQIACYAPFHCDHFLPKYRGGITHFGNLIFACPTCNGAKRLRRIDAADPTTGLRVPLFNPRIDVWDEHFRWSANGLKILGKTPIGRATVRTLRFNRRGVSVLRSMLLELGLHNSGLEVERNGLRAECARLSASPAHPFSTQLPSASSSRREDERNSTPFASRQFSDSSDELIESGFLLNPSDMAGLLHWCLLPHVSDVSANSVSSKNRRSNNNRPYPNGPVWLLQLTFRERPAAAVISTIFRATLIASLASSSCAICPS